MGFKFDLYFKKKYQVDLAFNLILTGWALDIIYIFKKTIKWAKDFI